MSAPTRTPGLALAADAARATARAPGLILALYAVQLVFAGAAWLAARITLGDLLADRPAPGLFEWVALARSHPAALWQLLLASAVIALGYLLAGAGLAGAILERLRGGRPLAGALRHFGRLLLLRLLVLAILAIVVAAGVIALPRLYELSLAWSDERLQAAALIGAALLLAVPCLAALLALHYGQPLVVAGRGVLPALGGGLDLVHGRPLVAGGLYLAGWALWAIATVPLWLAPGIVLAQGVAVARVAIHLWTYACASSLERAR